MEGSGSLEGLFPKDRDGMRTGVIVHMLELRRRATLSCCPIQAMVFSVTFRLVRVQCFASMQDFDDTMTSCSIRGECDFLLGYEMGRR